MSQIFGGRKGKSPLEYRKFHIQARNDKKSAILNKFRPGSKLLSVNSFSNGHYSFYRVSFIEFIPLCNCLCSQCHCHNYFVPSLGGMGLSEKAKNTTPVSPSPELSFIDKVKKIPSDKHLIQELELPELMLPLQSRKGCF